MPMGQPAVRTGWNRTSSRITKAQRAATLNQYRKKSAQEVAIYNPVGSGLLPLVHVIDVEAEADAVTTILLGPAPPLVHEAYLLRVHARRPEG